MNPRVANLPEGHPMKQRFLEREALESNPAYIIAEAVKAAQARLDTFAKEKGYDNILSACSYATSTNPTFAAEAATCIALRDATWATFYTLQAEIQAGTRQMPTKEELVTLLPVLIWEQTDE